MAYQFLSVTGDDPFIQLLDPKGRIWLNDHWYLNEAGQKRYAYSEVLVKDEVWGLGPVKIDPRPARMHVLVDGRGYHGCSDKWI